MPYLRRTILLNLLRLSDMFIFLAALLIASWTVTYHMRYISLEEFLSLRLKLINFIGILGMTFLWHFLCNHFHLYTSRRLNSLALEWKDIVKVTSAGTVLLFLIGQIFRISMFTSQFIGAFWLSSTILTISFRTFLRYFLRKVRLHGRNLRFVVIIGTNQKAYDFARRIDENPESGYRVLGYIDDTIYLPENGKKLLGTPEDFSEILNTHVVDEVVIALPIKSNYEMIQEIVQKAEEQGLTIRYLYDLFNTKVAQTKAETFDDSSVLTMSSWPYKDWQYLVKRTTDIILAFSILLATSPLLVLAVVAIKLTSRGTILFVQDRVGYNKRLFRLYKFRTMVLNAEALQSELKAQNEMDGPVFKIKNDPRITYIGRLLRKTSIDELPQLFNVINGDMSLVGPRPLPVRDYNGFDKDWQRRRFSVLPGITCTWQISGRNNISFEDWMKLDMEYIDNWNLLMDFKILVKTIPAVVRGSGAS